MTGTRRWTRRATTITAFTAAAALVAVILAIGPSHGPQAGAEDPSPTAAAATTRSTAAATTAAATVTAAQAASPNETPTATTAADPIDPPPAPTLITVATGERGELLLEWTPNSETLFPPQGVTGWQYRQQWEPEGHWDGAREDTWAAWTDVPGSTAATRSYRFTGLETKGTYFFQVRALAGSVEGHASEAVFGNPAFVDEHGIPEMPQGQIVEGGRAWRLGWSAIVFDIPAGTRLVLAHGSLGEGNRIEYLTFRDVETGSSQLVNIASGRFLSRDILEGEVGAGKGAGGASSRDVDAIFDQIRDSARLVE